ncbi:MAG: hypothetical protein ACK5KM_02835 [Hyphomicrobiaceae bacterium]
MHIDANSTGGVERGPLNAQIGGEFFPTFGLKLGVTALTFQPLARKTTDEN